MKTIRTTLSLIALSVLTSCSSIKSNEPDVSEYILLPRLYSTTNTVDRAQADHMASDYFLKYVSGCGIPAEVKDEEDYWSSELWGGFAGYAFYGTLWIKKTDGEVFLEPPAPAEGRLPPWTMMKINEVANQQVEPIVTTPVDEVEAQSTQPHP